MKTFKKDLLTVNIYETRAKMGEAAAADILFAVLADKARCDKVAGIELYTRLIGVDRKRSARGLFGYKRRFFPAVAV